MGAASSGRFFRRPYRAWWKNRADGRPDLRLPQLHTHYVPFDS